MGTAPFGSDVHLTQVILHRTILANLSQLWRKHISHAISKLGVEMKRGALELYILGKGRAGKWVFIVVLHPWHRRLMNVLLPRHTIAL